MATDFLFLKGYGKITSLPYLFFCDFFAEERDLVIYGNKDKADLHML